jgi:hypothetical protein
VLREMPAGNAKMPHTLGMIGADSARSRRLFFNGLGRFCDTADGAVQAAGMASNPSLGIGSGPKA